MKVYDEEGQMEIVSSNFAIIRAVTEQDRNYLKKYLETEDWQILLKTCIDNSFMQRINVKKLKELKIPNLSDSDLEMRILETLKINGEDRYYTIESQKHLKKGEYDNARNLIEEVKDSELKDAHLQNINNAEALAKKDKELEDMMSMFAHKFRSPLDAIIYNTNHENNPKLYIEAAQTMRGLLDVFSIISTDEKVLKNKIKADNSSKIVPEEVEEPVDLKAEMSNIMSRVAENGVVSTADMTSIKKMEEQLIATPEDAQEQKLAAINSLKDKYKAQLLDKDNDTVVLKSKRDLMYAMQDIGEVDDAVDEVLYAKAVKAGIVKDKEEYTNIKKDFAVVDAEAKSGRIGYLTLTRDLENLLDASSPNTGKVDKLVKQLINYEKTQQDYLNKGTELYNRVQKEIEAYNAPNDTNLPRKAPKSASSVEMDNGYKFTVYTELDANGKVQIKSNKALQDILEAKRLNIAGIKEGLQSVVGKLDSIGLSAADTGVTNKPIINAKGNKWLDAFAKDLKGSENTPEATHIYAIGSGKRATAIKESNLSGTNLTDYTKDSVVYITMDRAKTQDDVVKL